MSEIVLLRKGGPCCLFVSRRARALVCLDSQKKKKKKKNGRALSAIALSRQNSSHATCAAVANVAQHRLHQCRAQSPCTAAHFTCREVVVRLSVRL